MEYNSHVFWYFVYLCDHFPEESQEKMTSFVNAHHEFMSGAGALDQCYEYFTETLREISNERT